MSEEVMDEETTQLNVRVPVPLMEHIEAIAAVKRWTLSRTVRAMLREALALDRTIGEIDPVPDDPSIGHRNYYARYDPNAGE